MLNLTISSSLLFQYFQSFSCPLKKVLAGRSLKCPNFYQFLMPKDYWSTQSKRTKLFYFSVISCIQNKTLFIFNLSPFMSFLSTFSTEAHISRQKPNSITKLRFIPNIKFKLRKPTEIKPIKIFLEKSKRFLKNLFQRK